jgi:pyruvate dehydrogenase E2 component (dihydrolipoamide acetyltransferase)
LKEDVPLVTEVLIPVMDQTGGDFLLAKWLKHEGDSVEVGDALCEIETNKASVELSAETAGVLRKVLVGEGAALPSLTVIALIADPHEPLPDVDPYYRVRRVGPSQDARAPAAVPARSDPSTGQSQVEIVASPRAKKLAAEHHVDLTRLKGSGPAGRIVEDDVRKAIQPP